MELEVLANALKAAINANLNANTGALRWQGAMTHRLEVGVGLEKKTYRWRAGPASLEWARYGARSIPCGPRSTVMHSELQDFGRRESYSRHAFSSHVIHRQPLRDERSRCPLCGHMIHVWRRRAGTGCHGKHVLIRMRRIFTFDLSTLY